MNGNLLRWFDLPSSSARISCEPMGAIWLNKCRLAAVRIEIERKGVINGVVASVGTELALTHHVFKSFMPEGQLKRMLLLSCSTGTASASLALRLRLLGAQKSMNDIRYHHYLLYRTKQIRSGSLDGVFISLW